uniref:Apple domain-containing protein n=1 Tax=viral metagenome TaxID=1070528 RepID=A0A6C0KV09_9ZZZZ
MSTTTLNQGIMFKKYQNKIRNETKIKKPSNKKSFWEKKILGKEGFESGDYANAQFSEIKVLQDKLNELLAEYDIQNKGLIGKTTEYSNIVSGTGKYSGKNVRFTTGHICYVTKQGVVRYIGSPDLWESIQGKYGCPGYEYIELGIPWSDSYWTEGTIIPTDPPLISGVPMSANEPCENYGQNVYVNEFVRNPTEKYVGCYRDKPDNVIKNPVPVLNSDSDQGFQTLSSSVYLGDSNSFGAFRAFDQRNDTWWHSDVRAETNYNASTGIYEGQTSFPYIDTTGTAQTMYGEWLWVHLPASQIVSSYEIIPRPDNGSFTTRSPNTWYIMGLNAGQSWHVIDYQENQNFSQEGKKFNITYPGSYEYYLIVPTVVGNSDTASSNNRYCVQIAAFNLSVASDSGFTNDNRAMSWDQGAYQTYDACKQMAVDRGYKYFGLQDVRDNGTAACLLSNDIARTEMYGEAMNTNMIPIWDSKTYGHTVNGMTMTIGGNAVIWESGTNAEIWISPNAPVDCAWGGYANPDTVQGSFGGNCVGKPKNIDCGNPSPTESYGTEGIVGNLNPYLKNAAINSYNSSTPNFSYSSLSEYTGGDPAFCCGKTVTYSYQCGGGPFKSGEIGGGANIDFDCSAEVANCKFFLILQGDGNLCIYRGTGPNDQRGGAVWCAMTNGQQKEPNPDWVASKGKFGVNYLVSGQGLLPGEWIGSDDGSLKLIMQTDGNLVLYTSTRNLNCVTKEDKSYGGGWANAVYELNGVGNGNNIKKLGYVDSNGSLSEYPADMIGKGTDYKMIQNYDSAYNDIPGMPLQNSNVDQCKSACNSNNDCAGFVFDRSSNNCWIKDGNMYPKGQRQPNSNIDLYLRSPTLNNNSSCSKAVSPIDTVMWDRYKKSDKAMSADTTCGLANVTQSSVQSTDEVKAQIADIASQIVDKLNNLGTSNAVLNTEMEKTKTQLISNIDKYKKIKEEFNKNTATYAVNISGILNDTDQRVLQENYTYMFWSILAIGIIIIIINMKKK